MKRLLAWRMEALGVGALGVAVVLVATLLAYLGRAFTDTVTVTAAIPLSGAPLPVGSEVKARGIVIGRVTKAKVNGDEGLLTLELDPSDAHRLPANVTSRQLPSTLFGKEFLDLVIPSRPQGHLGSGAAIHVDTDPESVETQRLLADTFPLLSSLHPSELNAALSALSMALSGRGEQIGTTLDTFDAYLKQLAPTYPALDRDIRELAVVSRNLSAALPDLAGTVDAASTTTRTLAAQRQALAGLLAHGTLAATDLESVLDDNESRLIALTPRLREVLTTLNSNRLGLARTVKSVPLFLDTLIRVSGGSPYFRIELQLDGVTRGVYTPADCPRYPSASGPNCPPGSAFTPRPYGGSAGPVGGAQERATVDQLAAPLLGVAPAAVPSTADLLLGPLLRGGLVTLP